MATTIGTPTPPEVEKLATQQARIEGTALIGIFGTPQAPHALIRLPRGETQSVSVGDSIAGATVEAIGEDLLVLSRMGSEQVLRMPRG